MRSHARRVAAAVTVAGIAAAMLSVQVAVAPTAAYAAVDEREITVEGAEGVQIDASLFVPDTATEAEPAAAIVLAHGYGGTKEQTRGQAVKFSRDGYVVLTFTARGFGESTGDVSINAPDYEVADARAIIDYLAEQPEVRLDGDGDPRVGFMGGSYGGALSLLVAGYDQRVDAVQATRTWNSLVTALFPNGSGEPAAGTPAPGTEADVAGVFKETWGMFFFEGGSLDAEGGSGPRAQEPSGGCEDMRQEYCAAYEEVLEQRQLTDDMRALLEASSPASVLGQITAPTLLAQGEGDKLFNLAEADANARGIAATGTPVKMAWVSGGHGAPRTTLPEAELLDQMTSEWFDFYLRDQGQEPDPSFTYTTVTAQNANGQIQGEAETAAAYPGLAQNGAASRLSVPLRGEEQEVEYPDNGEPAAYTSLPPGFTPDDGPRNQAPEEIDGQFAAFETDALVDPLTIIGAPTIAVDVASSSGEAVLFAKIYDVAPDGQETLVQGLVSPVRLTDLPGSVADAPSATVTLPGIARTFEAGHQVRVVLATTDQMFATPPQGATYTIALSDGADAAMAIPDITGDPVPEFEPPVPGGGGGGNRLLWIALGVAVILVLVGGAFAVSRRRSVY